MYPKVEATQRATDNLLACTMYVSSKVYISQVKDGRWEHDRCTSVERTATGQQARSAATNYLKHTAVRGQGHTSATANSKTVQQQMATQSFSPSATGRLTPAHAVAPQLPRCSSPLPCSPPLTSRALLCPSGNRAESNQFNVLKTAIVSGYIIILNCNLF